MQILLEYFRHLLKNNLVFCAKSDVEFYVWKICFYNLVSTLKLWLNEGTIPQSERPNVENNVIELLNEGLEFYSEMLETLDDTYHINLEQYYDVLEPRSTDTTIRCALVSAQKCLLCLGDLARYKVCNPPKNKLRKIHEITFHTKKKEHLKDKFFTFCSNLFAGDDSKHVQLW